MIIRSLFDLRQFLSLEIGHFLVTNRPGDQYLVSFPRSGNTWMRTMLAYLLDPASENNPDIRNKLILGVSIQHAFLINRMKSPRYIKSHTWYRKEIPRAVYIVRDGRDVIVSLYHYYITRRSKSMSFPDFFIAYLQGRFGQRWHLNVKSWLLEGQKKMGDNLLIIHFENMKSDTQRMLRETADFLGIYYSECQIESAVKAASLSRMRKVEEARRGSLGDENESFYRGGESGEWQEYMSPDLESAYIEVAGNALRIAGYLD